VCVREGEQKKTLHVTRAVVCVLFVTLATVSGELNSLSPPLSLCICVCVYVRACVTSL
jgi:hypothetical protein